MPARPKTSKRSEIDQARIKRVFGKNIGFFNKLPLEWKNAFLEGTEFKQAFYEFFKGRGSTRVQEVNARLVWEKK